MVIKAYFINYLSPFNIQWFIHCKDISEKKELNLFLHNHSEYQG